MTTFHSIRPYSEVYGAHPSTIIATQKGFQFLSQRADPFTGKLGEVIKARMNVVAARRNAAEISQVRTHVIANQNVAFLPDLSVALCRRHAKINCTLT